MFIKIITFTSKRLKLFNMGSKDEAYQDMDNKYEDLEHIKLCVSIFEIML